MKKIELTMCDCDCGDYYNYPNKNDEIVVCGDGLRKFLRVRKETAMPNSVLFSVSKRPLKESVCFRIDTRDQLRKIDKNNHIVQTIDIYHSVFRWLEENGFKFNDKIYVRAEVK